MVGILALQGAFAEHEAMLKKLGASCRQIRQRRDFDASIDHLIIPGGESTVMGKLLEDLKLAQPVKEYILSGMPVLGTCAGLILLAKEVEGGAPVLATMDICAKRNAYGRQLGSFHTAQSFGSLGEVPMTFIRAPYITHVGDGVEILAEVDGRIVAARQGRQLVTAFHPELDESTAVHSYFLEL